MSKLAEVVGVIGHVGFTHGLSKGKRYGALQVDVEVDSDTRQTCVIQVAHNYAESLRVGQKVLVEITLVEDVVTHATEEES